MLKLFSAFRKEKIWDFDGGIHPPEMKTQSNGTSIVVGSLEASNVDMADEFTRMMIVQKAYSMASTTRETVARAKLRNRIF